MPYSEPAVQSGGTDSTIIGELASVIMAAKFHFLGRRSIGTKDSTIKDNQLGVQGQGFSQIYSGFQPTTESPLGGCGKEMSTAFAS